MKTPEEVASAVADKLQMIGRPRWPQEIAFVRAGMIEGLLEAAGKARVYGIEAGEIIEQMIEELEKP